MSKKSPTPIIEPALITTDTLAAMLSVSRATVYNLRQMGRIGPRAYKLGKSVRYSLDEVRAWLAAGLPPLSKWEAMKGTKR